MQAGLFHYQAAANPMPERFNMDGRPAPQAWSFHNDSVYYNSFTKLTRALRDLRLLQEDRQKQSYEEFR
jgi:hypothetical protein